MERDELRLRERIARLLETYSLEELLEYNEMTEDDLLVLLISSYDFSIPDNFFECNLFCSGDSIRFGFNKIFFEERC